MCEVLQRTLSPRYVLSNHMGIGIYARPENENLVARILSGTGMESIPENGKGNCCMQLTSDSVVMGI
jgi:hypothetical protein